MTIAVLADETLKQEWLSKNVPDNVELIWADSVRSLTMVDADAYFDLLFTDDGERTGKLRQVKGKPFFVNAVTSTNRSIGEPFIRINAWPTMLQRPVTEISLPAPSYEDQVRDIFRQLDWRYQPVPDLPGMITARVLAMIINEAYYTYGAGVSTKEEIDIAMKLGTNYPLGPFAWSEKIGLQRIYELLVRLGETDPRYTVAPALEAAIKGKV